MDLLEQNEMSNSCTAILIALTVLVMLPALTVGEPPLNPLRPQAPSDLRRGGEYRLELQVELQGAFSCG